MSLMFVCLFLRLFELGSSLDFMYSAHISRDLGTIFLRFRTVQLMPSKKYSSHMSAVNPRKMGM